MKKSFLLVIGLVLALMLAACGNENAESDPLNTEGTNSEQTSGNKENTNKGADETPTAEELLQRISEASEGIKSYSTDSTIKQNMKMTVDGKEQSQDINMNMKIDIVLSPVTAYSELTMSVPGEESGQVIKQYITEEGIYSQLGDTWMKFPEDMAAPLAEQMKNQSNAASQFDQLKTIANDLIVEEKGDVYLLTADLSGDKVKELAASMLSQNGAAATTQMTELMDQMNIKSMNISYSVDKETYYPKDLVFSMDMDMDSEDEPFSITMEMNSSITDYNSKDKIEVPQEVKDSAVEQQVTE